MNRIATLLGVSLLMTALPIASAVAQQPATPTSPQAILVGSDSLVGGAVRDNEGRDIGKVSRLMIDPNDGRITSIVIATGGTLGVGSNTISIPWSSVKIGQDRGKVIVTASQTLESAPARASTAPDQQRKQ
jgi:sporulation protein YlmC with PRC-barrel domain